MPDRSTLLNRYRPYLRPFASLVAVAWLATLIPYSDVAAAFGRFDSLDFTLAMGLLAANNAVACLRFRAALRARRATAGWTEILVAFGLGQVSNSLLLSVVGQSLTRATFLARHGVDFGTTILATYVERIVALAVLAIMAAGAGSLLLLDLVPDLGGGIGALAFSLLVATSILVLSVMLAFGTRRAAGIIATGLLATLGLWRVAALTIAAHVTMLCAYLVLLAGSGEHAASPMATSAAVTIVMFLSAIPISFAGWGLRELSAAHVLVLVDVHMANAVAVALAIGAGSMLLTLTLGGVAMAYASRERGREAQAGTEAPRRLVGKETLNLLGASAVLCACMIFFQMRIPVSAGELTINLADIVALTALGIVALLHSADRRWSAPRLLLAITFISAGFVFALGVGWIRYGLNAWALTNRGLGWIIIVGYATLGAAAGHSDTIRDTTLRVLIVAGTSIAALQLAQLALAHAIDLRAIGFFVPLRGFAQNANAFSVQLVVAAIAAIVLHRDAHGLRARTACHATLATLGAAIFLSNSRTGFIMLGLLALAAPFASGGRLDRASLGASAAILAGPILAAVVPRAVVGILSFILDDPDGLRLLADLQIRIEHRSSDGERWQTIADGIALWLRHPLIGAGLGAYVQARRDSGQDFQVIHSVPVWILAEFGIVGAIAVAVAFALLLVEALRSFMTPATRHWGFGASAILLCVGAAFLVHDFFFQRIFWFGLGLFAGAAYLAEGKPSTTVTAAIATTPRAAADIPRVSVVIPFYNADQTIAQTLASLDAQSFRDFDVTIVDDGSTSPGAQAALDALPGRFRVVRQENRGLPGARNAGIAASAGELVLPLDSDDLLEPQAIARLVAALDADPRADLAFSWTMRFDEESGLSQMAFHPVEQLFVNEAPYCMLMRRALVARAGGYDETMREGYEDWEFNIRLVGLGARAAIVPEPLFRYRVRQRGMLKSRTMGQHVQIWRAIRARHRGLYAPGAIWRAWRGARGQRHIWPMPALLGWGLLLLACPPALFNPAYRAIVAATRGLRDRYKARAHGTG